MKRKFPIVLILIIISTFCFIGAYVFLNIRFGWQIWISRRIEVLVPFSVELEHKDSHGGFNGDGECVIKVYLSKQQAEKFKDKIEKNNHWKQLPMPDKLQMITGARIDKDMCIPIVKNGYYFFLDRHSEADDKYNPYEMYEEFRASSNYTVAVFDCNENILYYYDLDT